MSPSLSSFFSSSMPSRRTLRTATRRMLGILVRELGEFLAPLGIERRDRQPQQRAVDDRVQAEVGLADGLVDGLTWLLSQTCTEIVRGIGRARSPPG